MTNLAIPLNNNDHVMGKKNASVTLVEYGDYECPYCGQAYPIVKELQNIEGNKLRFVFRNFPLSQIHPHALHAAYAAEAAGLQGEGKFWEMHDIIYENQQALEDRDLASYAETIGLDMTQFSTDFESEPVTSKVRADFIGGIRSGVNGTPTFFINGLRFDGSYQSEFLLAAIEDAAKSISKPRGRRQGSHL